MSNKYPSIVKDDNIWINAQLIPNDSIITEINNLRVGESLKSGSKILAFRSKDFKSNNLNEISSNAQFSFLNSITHIFTINGSEINNDFLFISSDKTTDWQGQNDSELLANSNIKIGQYPIYVEKGAKINHSIFNTTSGPIYIGKDAEVMEGSIIRGPFAMCKNLF